MKKLICAKDIETLHSNGHQVMLIDDQTIITPSAKDLADEYHMKIKKSFCEKQNSLSNVEGISKEDLVNLLKKLLNEVGLAGFEEFPFEYQTHTSGLKIIRGSTVKLSPISDENDRVRYQEIVTLEESNMNFGLLEIDNSSFYEKDTAESVNHVVSGELTLTIDNAVFTAAKGDIIVVPKHSTVHWSTPSKVTILCGKSKQGG